MSEDYPLDVKQAFDAMWGGEKVISENASKYDYLCMDKYLYKIRIRENDYMFLSEFFEDFKDSKFRIYKEPEMCPNCKKPANGNCDCMKNKCDSCGKPVGNITFTVCDKCWDAEHKEPEKPKLCEHCSGNPGAPTMLRWNWNYCPECGRKLI